MAITYSYDAGRKLLETHVSGDVRLSEVDEYFQRVSGEPWFPAASLTDVREAHASMPSTDVRAIAALLRRLGPVLRGIPLAVLVGSEVAFGLVRMLGLLLDDDVNVRPFRSAQSALAWLREYEGSI